MTSATLFGLLLIGFSLICLILAYELIRFTSLHLGGNKLLKTLSIIFLLSGLFLILKKDKSLSDEELQKEKGKESRTFVKPRAVGWDEVKKLILIKQCLEKSKKTSEKYPEIANNYCNCSSEKIVQEISYESYQLSLSKSKEEQMQLLMPTIQPCVDIMMQLIQLDQEEKQIPQ